MSAAGVGGLAGVAGLPGGLGALGLGGLSAPGAGCPATTVAPRSVSSSTPAGMVMSDTWSAPPMVSAEMSRSTDGGMSVGLALIVEGEQLLVDDAVAVADLDRLAHQVDGDLGADQLVAADDEEVDVGDRVAHRVVLDVTGQGQVVRAVRRRATAAC